MNNFYNYLFVCFFFDIYNYLSIKAHVKRVIRIKKNKNNRQNTSEVNM